uniref:Chondroitin proteoglycan 4 domain-containing protein n=1 Tax=Plectus sambesii TaxID=2011161 RepID=A0A914VB26_9BILA
MIFALTLLLSVASIAFCEENVYRTAFDTGVLLANGPDEIQAPKSCESDCAKALEVEMVLQGIPFDENLLSALNDSTSFDSICSFYEQQLTTCFAKCPQRPANAVVALLQLVCVDKRQALTENSECAAQMESTMTEMCVNNCLRRQRVTKRNSPIAARQQDTCTRSHCIIKCLGAQLTECDLAELKGVYELMSGAQMLMGFQRENALELTAERLRSTDLPAKCRSLMQASHAVMRNVVVPQNSEDGPNIETSELEELKLQNALAMLDKESKELNVEIKNMQLQ